MKRSPALVLAVSLIAACASSEPGGGNGAGGSGSGGTSASGGSIGSGGTTGSGGATGSGGSTGSGGTKATGGATGQGGTIGTGGAATGGTTGQGGSSGAAGMKGTGGTTGTGGTATGGTTGTGGSASGGTTGQGGSSGAAGMKGTGGTTGTGGAAGMKGTGGTGAGGTSATGGSGGAGSSVHVVGNQIYDGTTVIRLMGVNRPGGEYSCVSGTSPWDPADGSGNNQATITAMLAWKVNAVRIPLNEDCWLNLNGVKLGGATYQADIQTWVDLLLQNDIYPILDLHWTENNGAKATGQQPMPDAANAPTFWGQVAAAYKNSPKVIFDLFNEPYPDNNMEATAAWTCWRDGGTCTGIGYPVAGMQSMLTAVRNAGATNLILLAGIEYANDLSQWMTYKPTDPAGNFAVSWHVYPNSNYTSNHTLMMDAGSVAGVAPIVATEIGGVLTGCSATSGTDDGSFITNVMSYLDGLSPPQSYVAWSWSTDDTPVIISNYNGTPVCSGTTYKAHLLATAH
ncbi:MAG TPA: cellulase family glycosylhydrolase [Polyangia bacterium]|nr:cellulase family glycosylhydrolase [Polyangia bacterium]